MNAQDPNQPVDRDDRVDRNLRTIGRHLSLPEPPTDAQRRRWKQPLRSVRSRSTNRGVLFMKNHRLLTLAGAGSAAAAALIAWSVLFAPTMGATVEAATVFASFKDALGSAFRVTFEDIGRRHAGLDRYRPPRT